MQLAQRQNVVTRLLTHLDIARLAGSCALTQWLARKEQPPRDLPARSTFVLAFARELSPTEWTYAVRCYRAALSALEVPND